MDKTEHFINASPSGRVRSLEFVHANGADYAFVNVRWPKDADALREAFHNNDTCCRIVSQTESPGNVLLMVEMHESQTLFLQRLAREGETFIKPAGPNKLADPWVWRGITSVIGQSMTFTSGMLSGGQKMPLVGFAGLNMIANVINVMFGSQEKPDKNQLKYLADKTNAQLKEFGATGVPNIENANAALPPDGTKKTSGQNTYEALQKYSVTGGEIGLRTIGSINLAFPLTSVYKEFHRLGKGDFKGFFEHAKAKDPATLAFGAAMITGKIVSFFSKEPDPHNPKPPGIIDTIREKVTFPLSSWIEGGGSAYFAHQMFTKRKINLDQKWVPSPLRKLGEVTDYFGGTGQTVFVGGYGIRLFAQYGTLEVEMPKLYKHVADGLAHVPEEKRLQATTELAQQLEEHFKKPQTHSAGTIYQGLAEALQKYHGVSLAHAPTTPQPKIHSETISAKEVLHDTAEPKQALS